jgi:DNA-binding FrmR family transcriptional regulator
MEKDRTWRKVLLKIIANRDALHPVGRRLLLRKLKKHAKRQRNRSIKAEQRAQRYEGFVEQLDDPKQVSAPNPLPFCAALPSPWDP